jgi:copper oxidase (laccase) domain-containing protein
MTADCLPILLTNKLGTEVAAIHAGWVGLSKGVIEATIKDEMLHRDVNHRFANDRQGTNLWD